MSGQIGNGSWLYRAIVNFLAFSILKPLLKMEIHGADNIPAEGSCVLASNHASFLDPPLIACAALKKRRAVRFMARDTLYKSILGTILRNVHTIPLSREKGDVGALRTALKAIKGGNLVSLFPEGTRTPDGELHEPKGGVAFLIAKASVPVIPIYIEGSFYAFPKGARFIKPHKVRIFVGEAISPAELRSDKKGTEAYREMGGRVMAAIAALRPQ
jgi:1-acyl-sn-glycerol-3-phosphate acyltransferase